MEYPSLRDRAEFIWNELTEVGRGICQADLGSSACSSVLGGSACSSSSRHRYPPRLADAAPASGEAAAHDGALQAVRARRPVLVLAGAPPSNVTVLQRLENIVNELRDDVAWLTDGVVQSPAELAPALSIFLLAGHPAGPAWLTLSALAIQTKYLVTAVGGVMAWGAYMVWHQANNEDKTRYVFLRSAASLAATGLFYTALGTDFHIPRIHGITILHEELVLRGLLDFVTMPLAIWNMGVLVGREGREIRRVAVMAALSSLFLAGSVATSHTASFMLFGMGTAWLVVLVSELPKAITELAREVPVTEIHGVRLQADDNHAVRMQVISEITMFPWLGTPVLVGCAMAGVGDPDLYLRLLAPLDLLQKCFGTMVLFRTKKEIYQEAYKYRMSRRAESAQREQLNLLMTDVNLAEARY